MENKQNRKESIKLCDNLNCQDNALLSTKNGETNPPIAKDDDALVECAHSDGANLKKRHEIPIVTLLSLIPMIYAILNHVHDFGSDIHLTIDYFENQKTVQGSLTLTFTILQAITTAWISSLMHHPEMGEVSAEIEDQAPKENWFKKAAKQTTQFCLAIISRMALPHCLLHHVYFAWKLRKAQQNGDERGQNYYHQKMLEEKRNSAWLKVVECFMESVPQLSLQLYILLMLQTPINAPMWSKIVSGGSKLIGFGSVMKKYHCAVRSAEPGKTAIGQMGGVLLFLWHFGTIAARIFVIGISASNWLIYTLIACFVNWIVWTVWIYATETKVSVFRENETESTNTSQTRPKKIQNFILACVLAVVYTFTFVNLGKGPSFMRNAVYYILCLLQNGTIVVVWVKLADLTTEGVWFPEYLLILSVILFAAGISAMVTYYMFFHPTIRSKICKLEACRCLTCMESGRG